jgi:hypothetical protein
MTMHPPPDPDDLASDLVDGLLPPDEAARLRADPAIAARVEAIESVRAALRVPPPSPPGAMDSAIGAALAAFDVPSGAPSGEQRPTLTAVPTPPGMGYPSGPQAPARPAKARPGGTAPWLAAAAVIVLLGLITIGILSQNSGDEDMASSSGDSGEQMTADDGADAAAEGAPEAAVPDSTAATASPGESETGAGGAGQPSDSGAPETDGRLGSVENTSELARQIASAGRQPGSTSASQSDGDVLGDASSVFEDEEGTCPGLSENGDPRRGRAVLVADAIYQGSPVRVHVYENPDGSQQLVATSGSCNDVVDTPYEP